MSLYILSVYLVYCVRMFVPSVSTVCLLCPNVCTVCVYRLFTVSVCLYRLCLPFTYTVSKRKSFFERDANFYPFSLLKLWTKFEHLTVFDNKNWTKSNVWQLIFWQKIDRSQIFDNFLNEKLNESRVLNHFCFLLKADRFQNTYLYIYQKKTGAS